MIYGSGDHMLDHLSHTLHSLPLFATVGLREKPIRPVAVEDVVRILQASLIEGKLSRETVAVVGPQQMRLSDAVRQLSRITKRRVLIFPFPIWAHRALAWIFEHTMTVPLISSAQVFMLSEGLTEPEPHFPFVTGDLAPRTKFEDAFIRERLPKAQPFRRGDFRSCAFLARK